VELRHLRYFDAVGEGEHFGRAAKRLHVVQPAVTRQVRQLEEDAATVNGPPDGPEREPFGLAGSMDTPRAKREGEGATGMTDEVAAPEWTWESGLPRFDEFTGRTSVSRFFLLILPALCGSFAELGLPRQGRATVTVRAFLQGGISREQPPTH